MDEEGNIIEPFLRGDSEINSVDMDNKLLLTNEDRHHATVYGGADISADSLEAPGDHIDDADDVEMQDEEEWRGNHNGHGE